jgi:YfiH family protein
MLRHTSPHGPVYYTSPLLSDLGVRHAFSTRIGGVSTGPFASLNLGNPAGAPVQDPPENLAGNYRRLSLAAGLPDVRCWSHQVHGCGVQYVEPGAVFQSGVPGDALISTDTFRCISIRAADCAAVLVSSCDGRTIAAIHAGWRGVVGEVIPRTLEAMHARGAIPYAAAVFPCISYEHFEVGPEVVEAFERLGLPARLVGGGKGRAGVAEACEVQLRRAGVEQVELSGMCTYANAAEFFSHRRDGSVPGASTGRMALLALARGD